MGRRTVRVKEEEGLGFRVCGVTFVQSKKTFLGENRLQASIPS